ncbi:MAG: hypothetical protein V5A62_02040 [Haloarculaceae archaeon]
MADHVTAFAGRNDGSIRSETRTTRVKGDSYERDGYIGKRIRPTVADHGLDARLSDLSSGVETRQTH